MLTSHILRTSVLLLVLTPGMAVGAPRITVPPLEREFIVVSQFMANVRAYLDARDLASEGSLCLPEGVEPEYEGWTPTEGAIFNPDVALLFRRKLSRALQRPEALRAALQEGADPTLRLDVRVNDRPPALANASTQWLESVLPRLPEGMTYRRIGRDLALVDVAADRVIDVIRQAISIE
jgi:hypothetical protein